MSKEACKKEGHRPVIPTGFDEFVCPDCLREWIGNLENEGRPEDDELLSGLRQQLQVAEACAPI